MITRSIIHRLPTALLFATVALNSLSFAADFAGRAPTEEEVIQSLDPPKTRGIRPGAAAKTMARPSLSMELQFDFNSSKLAASEEGKLSGVVTALKSERLSAKALEIVGHTDAKGSDDYNKKLSERRAAAVVDFLVKQGVEPNRLKSVGMGKAKPKNADDPFAAENRRVEFVVAN